MAVTLWGRVGDPASVEAQRFLKQNGYRPDRVADLDKSPPTADDLRLILKGLVALSDVVDPKHPAAGRAPIAPDAVATDREALAAWLTVDPKRIRSPVLLTPRGAVCGFREQKWRSFLGIGATRGD